MVLSVFIANFQEAEAFLKFLLSECLLKTFNFLLLLSTKWSMKMKINTVYPYRGTDSRDFLQKKAVLQLLLENSSWCGQSYSLGKVLKLNQKTGLCLINRFPREPYRESNGTLNSHSLILLQSNRLLSSFGKPEDK